MTRPRPNQPTTQQNNQPRPNHNHDHPTGDQTDLILEPKLGADDRKGELRPDLAQVGVRLRGDDPAAAALVSLVLPHRPHPGPEHAQIAVPRQLLKVNQVVVVVPELLRRQSNAEEGGKGCGTRAGREWGA